MSPEHVQGRYRYRSYMLGTGRNGVQEPNACMFWDNGAKKCQYKDIFESHFVSQHMSQWYWIAMTSDNN